jgi:hypothetical protein
MWRSLQRIDFMEKICPVRTLLNSTAKRADVSKRSSRETSLVFPDFSSVNWMHQPGQKKVLHNALHAPEVRALPNLSNHQDKHPLMTAAAQAKMNKRTAQRAQAFIVLFINYREKPDQEAIIQ